MPEQRGSVVTIGAYDGVHRGHRSVIGEVISTAREKDLRSVVVTFDRHPASVVRPESAPLQLTDLEQRLQLLEETGVDEVKVIAFNPERAAESAEDFVDEILVAQLHARVVVVGRDFHFGKERRGNVALLEEMGSRRGFTVAPFDLISADADGSVVSSTRIRRLVADGSLREAARLLGRPHEVRGRVVAEVSAFTGVGQGSAGASVVVPADILLPPPGGYRAAAGPSGVPVAELERCHVVVPPERGALALLGTGPAYPKGTGVRILFEEAEVLGGGSRT